MTPTRPSPRHTPAPSCVRRHSPGTARSALAHPSASGQTSVHALELTFGSKHPHKPKTVSPSQTRRRRLRRGRWDEGRGPPWTDVGPAPPPPAGTRRNSVKLHSEGMVQAENASLSTCSCSWGPPPGRVSPHPPGAPILRGASVLHEAPVPRNAASCGRGRWWAGPPSDVYLSLKAYLNPP